MGLFSRQFRIEWCVWRRAASPVSLSYIHIKKKFWEITANFWVNYSGRYRQPRNLFLAQFEPYRYGEQPIKFWSVSAKKYGLLFSHLTPFFKRL